jgi:hypothetical chaperone protein
MQFIGLDFGTSNSLASLFLNDKIEFVKFSDGGISNPTILYFPAKSKFHRIGNDAVENYLTDIEEGGISGRLMLSIKTLLPEANFDYTIVAGHGRLSAADLAAKFLSTLKQMAERQFSQKFDGVVLGRPVQFSDFAIARLEKAAKLAGFKEVVFWLEPVAAALAYERTTRHDELICVVDLGGGTSDICIIETSPTRSLSPDRIGDIKATSGVNKAGDELSSQIMKEKLAVRFGAGSSYKSLGRLLPFPAHIIYRLSEWHRINLLNDSGDKSIINDIIPYSDRAEDVERLLNLIEHRHGFELFRAIDAAKKNLSETDETLIRFSPLGLREPLAVGEFENLITETEQKIKTSIADCLRAASVTPAEIDRVILTGGTSQVPRISRMVTEIFGAEKILRPDFFSSVATGLGYVASTLNR